MLRGTCLEVARGEAVAVVGENGCGKSTLLKICGGLLRPDDGSVHRAQRVGYCPQQPGLVELLNIGDHVRLATAGLPDVAAARSSAHQLLETLGLDPGIRTAVKDLSGGQRQKLNLALSLVNDPQLLLLDEPYQGFDHGSYIDLWDLIGQWTAEGRAVVIITHLLAERDRVDRALTLAGGVLS